MQRTQFFCEKTLIFHKKITDVFDVFLPCSFFSHIYMLKYSLNYKMGAVLLQNESERIEPSHDKN